MFTTAVFHWIKKKNLPHLTFLSYSYVNSAIYLHLHVGELKLTYGQHSIKFTLHSVLILIHGSPLRRNILLPQVKSQVFYVKSSTCKRKGGPVWKSEAALHLSCPQKERPEVLKHLNNRIHTRLHAKITKQRVHIVGLSIQYICLTLSTLLEFPKSNRAARSSTCCI